MKHQEPSLPGWLCCLASSYFKPAQRGLNIRKYKLRREERCPSGCDCCHAWTWRSDIRISVSNCASSILRLAMRSRCFCCMRFLPRMAPRSPRRYAPKPDGSSHATPCSNADKLRWDLAKGQMRSECVASTTVVDRMRAEAIRAQPRASH